MKNKVSYVELLKEAISEYDTKSFDYKGPLLDPIISFDGEGELKTQKDATSVLERYYFKEKNEDTRLFVEDVQEEEPEENIIETGEEADKIDKTMEDLEEEILGDGDVGDTFEEADESLADDIIPDKDKKDDLGGLGGNDATEEADKDGEREVSESIEQAVIEKLINEMEEVAEADEGVAEGEEVVEGDDISEELELEMAMLEAEESAVVEGEDVSEDLELEMAMLEAEEAASAGEETKDEEPDEEPEVKKDLDVDAAVKKESYGLGPINQNTAIEEAFRLFKEQIESEEAESSKEKTPKEETPEGEEEGEDKEAKVSEELELEMAMLAAEETNLNQSGE